jgi:hypothetical protein
MSTSLDLSSTDFSDPARLLLNPPNLATLGSSWWTIAASVASDGTIYHNVSNYRSGATLDLGSGSSVGAIVARRLSVPVGDKWRIVRKSGTGALYSLLKLEKPGMALAVSKDHQLLLQEAKEAIWSLRKVEFQVIPGIQDSAPMILPFSRRCI